MEIDMKSVILLISLFFGSISCIQASSDMMSMQKEGQSPPKS